MGVPPSVPSLPASPHPWAYPTQCPTLKPSSGSQDRLSSSHPQIPLSISTNHAKRRKGKEAKWNSEGLRNSEGECTAGRTETWLKTRGPHDSTAIHKHTCLQPVLPPTPRLSWWVHWPFLTTQNCAGLRRTSCLIPVFGKDTGVVWRKESLKVRGPSHPLINTKGGTGPSLVRVQA